MRNNVPYVCESLPLQNYVPKQYADEFISRDDSRFVYASKAKKTIALSSGRIEFQNWQRVDNIGGLWDTCIDPVFVKRRSSMAQVKISSKYQIVIPRDVREALNIRKGQTVSVIPVGNVIEVVPDQDISDMEGIFPDLTLEAIRDESDGQAEKCL